MASSFDVGTRAAWDSAQSESYPPSVRENCIRGFTGGQRLGIVSFSQETTQDLGFIVGYTSKNVHFKFPEKSNSLGK